MLPPFEAAAMALKATRPDLHLVIAAADTVADEVKARVAGWPHRAHVVEGEAAKLDAMAAATRGDRLQRHGHDRTGHGRLPDGGRLPGSITSPTSSPGS